MLSTASLTTRSTALAWKCASSAAKGGNGGCRLYGSSSGRGSMHPGFFSSLGAFAMSTVGDYRPSAAALLGLFPSEYSSGNSLTCADSQHHHSGLRVSTAPNSLL